MTNHDSGTTKSPQDNPPQRSRFEAEVLEILERSEQPIPFHQRVRRITWRRRRARFADYLMRPLNYVSRYGSRTILIAAGVSALIALFANDASPLLSRIAAFAFIILIAVFFFVGFRGSPRGNSVKRWRGRDIDFDSSRDSDDGPYGGRWRR